MHRAIALAVRKRIHHPPEAPHGLAPRESVSRRLRDQEEGVRYLDRVLIYSSEQSGKEL